ncbi:hypothetical protein Gasu2_28160 [Galdieria sulphuraria]|uniref:Uncharacterized protein n=1 Tax=Galdieria sulphuraria TaxID=130081 RepID=M2VZ20_GALSU|nr:uncharacterized protein Gasu_39390 [Galdieria sulphuraria]EME28561.1 hypothetical protein Gasu_39390 [Galdieria sulphuraria]GJD08519.1 hypothetical protein Gasu2_28160 [Galdieria sulphuraria]|eukprot:XP_005705081.1 hypothetical protein Gasu_39390 [Galdieria sulphuraria]
MEQESSTTRQVDGRDFLETAYLEPDLSKQDNIFEILPDGTKTFESNFEEEKESTSAGSQPLSSKYRLTDVQTRLESAAFLLSQLHFILSKLEQNELLEVTFTTETERSALSMLKRPEKAFMKQAYFMKLANHMEERHKKLSRLVERQQERLRQFIRLRKRCTGIRISSSGLCVQGSVAIDDTWYNLNLEDPEEKFIEKQDVIESSIATGPGDWLGQVKFPSHLNTERLSNDRKLEKKLLIAISRARFFAFQRRAFRYLVNACNKCNHILYYYQNRVHVQVHPRFHVVFGLIRPEELNQVSDSPMNRKWDAFSYWLCEWSLFSPSNLVKSFDQLMKGESKKSFSLEMNKVLNLLYTLESTEELETTADRLASHFGLQLEWLYGKELGQIEVKLTANKSDGKGPQVLLGTATFVAPCSVWFTPAFRVYCQGVLEVLQVSSTHSWSWISRDEDYPPSFECPISQLPSIIALLLCGRLLHSLELIARCHKCVFEVDRQGLALAVRGRRTFVTLWLEVIPFLEKHGEMEEIGLEAYLNGECLNSMEMHQVGLFSWFHSQLCRLDSEDERLFFHNEK